MYYVLCCFTPFNVKRQLLLFADETPILWAFPMRKGVKIYKKIKKIVVTSKNRFL